MKGLMMDFPLTMPHLFERSRRLFPKKEIVTRTQGGVHRYTYAEFAERTARLAGAFGALGIKPGDRVGTFAWNSFRHLELYWGVPCSGAVLHTLNIRLAPGDLTYIVNHAEDSVLFVDQSLWHLIEPIRNDLKTVRRFIIMPDGAPGAPPRDADDYETLINAATPIREWPKLGEDDAAGMCYTSGTTGRPKGVVYSHRANYLHALALTMADSFAIGERDTVMPLVPMFHANAWGFPITTTMVGAKQVYPGPSPQPNEILELIQRERVTYSAGVPTVWLNLLPLLETGEYDISSLRAITVGGSAAPRSLIQTFEKKYGVRIIHAWGMTEMTPLGTVSGLKHEMDSWPEGERFAVRAKQGVPVVGVEVRAVDEKGTEVPWDGHQMGELQVRGPWVASAYYRSPESADRFTQDGWFRTGDVVTIDAEGYIQITDRTKDLIKSGGEWISSVDLESLLMAHPKVLEACVVSVRHPKWDERPLACVVPRPEHRGGVTQEELIEFLRPQVAKWWLPDEVVFIESVPKTSVGKFDKKALRDQFKEWKPNE
jgi:fatty-acyl-CoA synthase